jgi:signal transduction histidine kinase
VAGEREDADFDLESALAALCDAMPLPEHRLQVDPRVAKLPAAHLQTLFRLAQEALTNCAKHSRAKLVTLSIHVEERAVIATIEDDGIGMQGAKAGNGLRGLEERVSLLAGTMTLSSHGAGGCRLVVTLPLKDPRDAGRDNG